MSAHPVAVFPASKTNRPRVAVLLNTNARAVSPRVVKAIGQVVPPSDLYVSKSFSDARAIVSEVVDRGYDTVLTGGGDGTFMGFLQSIREQSEQSYASDGNVVRALAPKPMPRFGVLRLGTGNALA
ncbi:MAG: diacylglycerol kinase family protein, partial [Myxococcota bacterium]